MIISIDFRFLCTLVNILIDCLTLGVLTLAYQQDTCTHATSNYDKCDM